MWVMGALGVLACVPLSLALDFDCSEVVRQTRAKESWVGDGSCDWEDPNLNVHPCYDGGDCCKETCTSTAEHTCGGNGYNWEKCHLRAERESLMSLFTSTNGDTHWTHNTHWGTTESYCYWQGVECAQPGRVTGLTLRSNRLTGTIPSQFTNLVHLQSLSMDSNAIEGSIPTQIGQMTALTYLDLSFNTELTDALPSQIGLLTALRVLDLSFAAVSGTLPTQIGNLQNLTRFWCQHCHLEGTIPTQLGLLIRLDSNLFLSENKFRGRIPSQIGKLLRIEHIDLRRNMLSKNIPSQIGHMSNLIALTMESNMLIGTIPSEIGLLSKLQWVDVSANDLDGTIPSQLFVLSQLKHLGLKGNKNLRGKVPPWFPNSTSFVFECSGTKISSKRCDNHSSTWEDPVVLLGLLAGSVLLGTIMSAFVFVIIRKERQGEPLFAPLPQNDPDA